MYTLNKEAISTLSGVGTWNNQRIFDFLKAVPKKLAKEGSNSG